MEIKLKPYPHPNPDVPGSTTRFATGFTTVEANGKPVRKEILKAADPACPVCEFKENPRTKTLQFVPVKDKKGDLVLRKNKKPIPVYIPSPELIELVRLAQVLQRPMLIKGEPGSGKTQFARAVAYEWYGAEYKNHFFEWQIKSTSKAVDGLYTFDHVARLRDAQLNRLESGKAVAQHKPRTAKENNTQYRTFGPMAKAFLTSTADAPSILLIDEIDKADIDFPNDLLLELDQYRFTIPQSETGETIEATYPPLVFITSNDERPLPEAFLRRCLFMYIKFPEHNQLVRIIEAHLPDLLSKHAAFVKALTPLEAGAKATAPPQSFVDLVIERFIRLRDEIKNDPADNKPVSTSELLDWLEAFNYDLEHPDGEKAEEVQEWIKAYKQKQKDGLDKEFIVKGIERLPFYYQAILKTQAAVSRREKQLAPSNPSQTR